MLRLGHCIFMQQCLKGRQSGRVLTRCFLCTDTTDHSNQSGHESATDHDKASATKSRILKAALHFVPEHGWSQKSLSLGADVEGLPSIAHGLFPRGGVELVYYFYGDCNDRLRNQMEIECQETQSGNKEKKKVNIFIRDSVITRLKMVSPYASSWPQAIGLMALPQNATDSLQLVTALIDDIWYYAGDRSADINWYTKRVSLAALYKSTELYMLQDSSENYENTWKFLDRRLTNLAKVGKTVRNIESSCSGLDTFFRGAVTTTRNMLGMNERNR